MTQGTADAADPAMRYVDPSRPARVGVAMLAGFVTCLGLWATLAPVSSAAIAAGNLQVESQRQSVQHPYGGVVSRLLVKEGDKVTKGQVLLTLSDSEPRARLDVLTADRDASLAQQARLLAERDGMDAPAFGPELMARQQDPRIVRAMISERAVMAARLRQFHTEVGMLRQKVAQLREQITGATAQIAGIDRQRETLEDELQGARTLLEHHNTTKPRVLGLERSMAQLDAERSGKLAEVASAEQAIGESELAIAKAEQARITDITDRLRSTETHLAELGPNIDAAQDVLDRTRIMAPATGSVVGMSVFTEGGVIQQGARLLDIIPSDHPLIADARLQLIDINDVKPGNTADVRLTSVPRNERPQLRGEVMTVSADRLTDEKSGQGYYLVRVRLNATDVANCKLELRPGMPADIIVTTNPRTFAQYLLGPMLDEVTGAFREK